VFGRWEYDNTNLCNSVIFKGGNIQYNTTETASGDDVTTVYYVTQTIFSIQVLDNGTIVHKKIILYQIEQLLPE